MPRINTKYIWRIGFAVCVSIVALSSVTAATAANSVPMTRAEDDRRAVVVNDKKPAECDGITLSNYITGSGKITGTDENDLIVGSPDDDSISGGKGDDCILGGGGDDTIVGNQGGKDVCIGGPGTDTLAGNCRIQIQ